MERGEEAVLKLARSLMAAGDQTDLLRQLASAAREAIGAEWAGVWIYDRRRKSFSPAVTLPDGVFSPAVKRAGRKGDLLAEVVARKGLVVRRSEEVGEPMLEHLGAAGGLPVREVFCVPFTLESDRLGLLELVRGNASAPEAHLGQVRFLSACASLASSAAASIGQVQAGRESQLAAINRLMQLYDVSQVFHATLERDALLPVIADRLGLILEAPLCRIWLPAEEGAGLHRAYPEGDEGTKRLEPGAGVPWRAFEGGESVLVPDAAEPEAAESIGELYAAGEAGSVICTPLIVDESCLGAIEVIRPPGAASFRDDDKDFLEELCRQAAIALRNSNLLLAEKKAHELGALLDISREITSTLDLDRVLATVVNRADAIVPCERCAILMGEGRAMELRAVSGHLEVDRKDPRLRDLEEILSWACLGGQGLYVSELDGAVETDRDETREKFRWYFEKSGMKTFVAFPLRDEEGLLGMLSVESSQPYFVPEEKLEVLNILANQATVAIRNASLYRQIPLINVMQPIVGWRSRLEKVPRWKWLRNAGFAAGLATILVLVPWNMKIAGKVVVLPVKNSAVTSEIEGIIEAVYRREGDRVRKGDLLAALLERDYRIRLEEARSRYTIADREVAVQEARLDGAAARQARIRRDQLREELELLRQELEKTRVAAPVDGVVLTPRLEQKVGTLLRKGEELCRIADMSEVAVEVLVPETEIAEIEKGQRVRLKMDSFPTETFLGRVEIVGQKLIEEEGGRFLIVRGRVDGGDRPLKAGMLGRAKIEVGRRALGYVILRKPARFLWRTLWRWLP